MWCDVLIATPGGGISRLLRSARTAVRLRRAMDSSQTSVVLQVGPRSQKGARRRVCKVRRRVRPSWGGAQVGRVSLGSGQASGAVPLGPRKEASVASVQVRPWQTTLERRRPRRQTERRFSFRPREARGCRISVWPRPTLSAGSGEEGLLGVQIGSGETTDGVSIRSWKARLVRQLRSTSVARYSDCSDHCWSLPLPAS